MGAREAKIAALAARGATPGERAAASSALQRIKRAQHAQRAELERAVGFGYRPEQVEDEAMAHRARMGRLDAEAHDDEYIPL